MTEKKHNFQRLAQKRTENVTEAIRIFGNLSSPNYDWDPEEIIFFISIMQGAIDEALDRFKAHKKWRDPDTELASTKDDDAPQDVAEAEVEGEGTRTSSDGPTGPSKLAMAATSPLAFRLPTIEEENDVLRHLVAMQRTVIADMQRQGRQTSYDPTNPDYALSQEGDEA